MNVDTLWPFLGSVWNIITWFELNNSYINTRISNWVGNIHFLWTSKNRLLYKIWLEVSMFLLVVIVVRLGIDYGTLAYCSIDLFHRGDRQHPLLFCSWYTHCESNFIEIDIIHGDDSKCLVHFIFITIFLKYIFCCWFFFCKYFSVFLIRNNSVTNGLRSASNHNDSRFHFQWHAHVHTWNIFCFFVVLLFLSSKSMLLLIGSFLFHRKRDKKNRRI